MEMIADERMWAQEVFGRCNLGDTRRTDRLVDYASRQGRTPEASSHAVCDGSGALKEGTFRFLRNEHVDPEKISEGGFLSTIERCSSREAVLVIEDTTTVNYHHEVAEELGTVGGVGGRQTRGFLVHSALAVDAHSREVIGLLEQHWWTRSSRKSKKHHKKREYHDKESYKWLWEEVLAQPVHSRAS